MECKPAEDAMEGKSTNDSNVPETKSICFLEDPGILFQALADKGYTPVFVEGPGKKEARDESTLERLRDKLVSRLSSEGPLLVFGQGDRYSPGVVSFIQRLQGVEGNQSLLVGSNDEHRLKGSRDGFDADTLVANCQALVDQTRLDDLEGRIQALCTANSCPEYVPKYAFLQEVVKLAVKQYFPRLLLVHTVPTKDIDPTSVTHHYVHGLDMSYLTTGEVIDLCNC